MDTFASRTVRLHPNDDVVIATVALPRGVIVETGEGKVTLANDVAPGHKIAIRSIQPGDPVRRYGRSIGVACSVIRPGEHVHVHNLRHAEPVRDDDQGVFAGAPGRSPRVAPEPRSFQGYARGDGRVGTRNYVAVLSTVNCSASVCHLVRDRFREVSRDHPNVDGVIALTHTAGCGQVAGGGDHRLLERVLAGYARHPNVAAFVLVGLGCEVAQAQPMIERHGLTLASGEPAPVLVIQQEGGVRKTVDAAVAAVARLLPSAAAARRTTQSASHLVLGTNCGGSDGYSGITANPALGCAFDELVRLGGAGILAETTEVFGAEHLLARRAADPTVARKLLDRIDWWRRYLRAHDIEVAGNPSPGNIAGGITTIVEKSLGAIAKSGTTPLVDVVDYGERVGNKGFIFMDTPGFDPVSVTGLVAGGANVLCFTTGRGSVFGCKPVPSIKLATSSELYRRMEDDMDIDCGVVVDGATPEEVGGIILDEILAVASGKRTKSELAGVGEAEFAPWVKGPTL